MKWPFGKRVQVAFAPPPAPVKALPYSRLTLDDWRSSGERVSFVAELLRQPLFLELVGMLSNIRLHHRGSIDATTAAMLLGQRSGQDLVIASLLAAGTSPPAPPAELAADYAAANVQAAWDADADA